MCYGIHGSTLIGLLSEWQVNMRPLVTPWRSFCNLA
jgi:hypothetical protein